MIDLMFLVIAVLMPTQTASDSEDYCAVYAKQLSQTPEADYAKASAIGDKRLLGVRGFTAMIPYDDKRYDQWPDREIVKRVGIRIIDGTSDSDCAEFNRAALIYARRYNTALLKSYVAGGK